MLRSYQSGQVEIVRVSRCYYDDDVARISRYAARLFVNPSNDRLEAVLYGKDITAVQEAYETQVSIVKTLSSNYLNVYLIHSREKHCPLSSRKIIQYLNLIEKMKRYMPMMHFLINILMNVSIQKIV